MDNFKNEPESNEIIFEGLAYHIMNNTNNILHSLSNSFPLNLKVIQNITLNNNKENLINFINIFTFPNSEPLISYSLSSQQFLSNFKGEKIEIENSDIIFENNTFIIGEINQNKYQSSTIKSDNKMIIISNI